MGDLILDNRFIGTYESFELEFYITENQVQISFKTFGIMHITPFDVQFTEDSCNFKINDENHRVFFELKFNENLVNYSYTQYGHTMRGIAEKSCNTAEFKEQYNTKSSYFSLLRDNKLGSNEYQNIDYQYDLYNQETYDFFNKLINLEAIINIQSDKEKAILCLDEVCKLLRHRGNSGLPDNRDVKSLFEYSKEYRNGINCRGLAIVLSELLRCIGLKAYHVTCMPYNTQDNDCHVITEVYCNDLNKWIMLDPSFNLYVMHNEVILNVTELRGSLENELNLTCYYKINHNGDNYSFNDYQNYMAKNTFRFHRGIISKDGIEHRFGNCVYLAPDGYDKDMARVDYRINNPKYFYDKK